LIFISDNFVSGKLGSFGVRHHEAVGGFFDASQERADSTSFEGYEANVGCESEHAYEQLRRACPLPVYLGKVAILSPKR